MYTLESSIADLETQQPVDSNQSDYIRHRVPDEPDTESEDDEFDEDDDSETAASLEQPKPTVDKIFLTMPVGDFSGWGPRMLSQVRTRNLN